MKIKFGYHQAVVLYNHTFSFRYFLHYFIIGTKVFEDEMSKKKNLILILFKWLIDLLKRNYELHLGNHFHVDLFKRLKVKDMYKGCMYL